jgi:pyruvate,water dikinase
MGVVIQPLINASVAGVLFTRNPITGANERVIEAARDLGDSVAQGRVVPDLYRLSPDGTLIELTEGDKRTETRPLPTGSIAEQRVPDERAEAPTLNQDQLRALHKLVLQCEQVWNCDHDIEWAFAQDGTLHLLQHRPITSRSPRLATAGQDMTQP